MVMQILVENSAEATFIFKRSANADRRVDLSEIRSMACLSCSTLSGAGTENGRPCGLTFIQ